MVNLNEICNKIHHQKKKYNVYDIEIETKEKMNKEKIFIIIVCIIVLIFAIVTINKILSNMEINKVAQEYEQQAFSIKQEEEEKAAKIAAQKEAERLAKIPNLTEQGKENMQHIYSSDTKRVFLTFDDGPSSNTSIILDILKEHNIVATFFELGSRVDANPELVKRSYDEGHYIANHGYSHLYSAIYASPESVLAEYNQCNDSIRNAIGVPEYNSHLFRFPGGFPGGPYADLKQQAKQLLCDNNIVSVDWNALSGDAEGNNVPVENLLARTAETVGTKQSVVILMHDAQAKSTTVAALPQIINFFSEQGYEFKNFYDIIK